MNAETPGLARYSPDRPLILVTDYPADVAGGGAVILRDLLGPAERERLIWASPCATSTEVSHAHFLRTGSAGRTGRRSLGRDSTIHAAALAREVATLARERNAPAVWIVMHGAGVGIAARLTRRGELPVHLTVHDDPAYANALRSKRYLALVPWISSEFDRAMRRAASVDVICEAMRERYRRRLGVDSVIVHRGLDGPIAPAPAFIGDRLRVGVLGSTYSYEQLPILAAATAEASRAAGVAGEIVVMGRSYGERLRAEMGDRIDVVVTGHVDEAAAVPILQTCLALYLNYPFGRRDAVLRQTSFPTKLSTYIQAARPLLLHVPRDSSVMPLIGPDRYAVGWHSNDPREGAALLSSLWNDPAARSSRHEAAEAVRLAHYDRATNRGTLFQALDALVP